MISVSHAGRLFIFVLLFRSLCGSLVNSNVLLQTATYNRLRNQANSSQPTWNVWVMLDFAYADFLDGWLDRFSTSGQTHPLVITCLDSDIFNHASSKTKTLSNAFVTSGWSRKANLSSLIQVSPESYVSRFFPELLSLLETGDVLHSDLDAVWLRSPDHLLEETLDEQDADIISSWNNEPMPPEALSEWGFVLNTGFMLLRRRPAVLKLIEEAMSSGCPDMEQTCLNLQLLQYNCTWAIGEDILGPTQLPDKHKKVLGRCGHLRIILLPWIYISRANGQNQPPSIQEAGQIAMVSHPELPSPKLNSSEKLHVLWTEGLFQVKQDTS